jgi:hypothetical protein
MEVNQEMVFSKCGTTHQDHYEIVHNNTEVPLFN